jgi:hypothetical protein
MPLEPPNTSATLSASRRSLPIILSIIDQSVQNNACR